ncbi:MAG: hypothetical protein L0387_07100 [Acidobacteria bacterium]|nr:hypothetical protein [Acidobacteriota bacterium]MCI0724441.1 hypothetical protein [Acidobacteriota bacterium]
MLASSIDVLGQAIGFGWIEIVTHSVRRAQGETMVWVDSRFPALAFRSSANVQREIH